MLLEKNKENLTKYIKSWEHAIGESFMDTEGNIHDLMNFLRGKNYFSSKADEANFYEQVQHECYPDDPEYNLSADDIHIEVFFEILLCGKTEGGILIDELRDKAIELFAEYLAERPNFCLGNLNDDDWEEFCYDEENNLL